MDSVAPPWRFESLCRALFGQGAQESQIHVSRHWWRLNRAIRFRFVIEGDVTLTFVAPGEARERHRVKTVCTMQCGH